MNNLPLTVKRSIELLGICLLLAIFSFASNIIMPLLMAFFVSLVLLPVYRFFRKIKMPEVIAIVLSILTASLVILGIGTLLSFQIGNLVREFPQIEKNINQHWQTLSTWVEQKFHVSASKQLAVLNTQSTKLLSNAGSYLSGAAVTVSGVFIFVGLVPIYVFLLMFYKNLLLRFVFLWFKQEDHPQVESALRGTQVIIKGYLFGLLIQVTYMTILLGTILMLLGIKHAWLIAIIFAVLNLIPYVGALIGNIIGVLLTLSSSNELSKVLLVLGVIAVVQFLDNNILMPRIVGSKVKINALVSIIAVIVGGTIAGISGMFLSLPLVAIFKIMFDHSTEFKHWGFLLGDERPGLSPMTHQVVRLRNKHIRKSDDDNGNDGTKQE
ncbi:MAG: AI-2E family transporter [Chitinophagaceae bacterium]|nr:AI-2E family transporter [Chitinophagaceae bacterium]